MIRVYRVDGPIFLVFLEFLESIFFFLMHPVTINVEASKVISNK